MMHSLTRSRPTRKADSSEVQQTGKDCTVHVLKSRRSRGAVPPDGTTQTYLWFKAVVDCLLALILFILALPVMLVAAALVKLTSPGPVVYSQVRLGSRGRLFWIYKIRTMYHDCEALTGAKWATKGDPRITPVGRWLRRLHIDELPQLVNVIRGEMSLVGPRPERPEIVESLEQAIPGYFGRLEVKPGVTGLAQIQLPPDSNLDSVRGKLVLDLCYVDRIGPSLDLRILIGTALYLMGFSYARIRQALFLPTGDPPETVAVGSVLEPS